MSDQFPEYKNPPIKEAIFAVFFKSEIDHARLSAFIKTDYCTKNECKVDVMHKVEIKATAGVKENFQSTQNPDGFSIKMSGENKNVIRVMRTHLSYHFFNKYTKWDNMFSEFKNIWKEYCESVGRFDITRVTVRYINQIPIPFVLPNGIQEYITLVPSIPGGISNTLNSFFIQVELPSEKSDMKAMITETILPANASSDKANILLDINVISEKNVSDDESLWNNFIELRKFKNHLFLNCTTEKTQKTFN